MKVLILTTVAGAGHNVAAKAIEEQYCNQYQGKVEAKVVDIFNPGHRFLSFFNNEFYFFLLRTFPALMRWEYRQISAKKPNHNKNGSKRVALRTKKVVAKLIETEKPDAIICTHPYAVAVTSYFKERKIFNIPTYAVVTDYCLLPHWENAYNMDGVFTSCKEIHESLIKRQVPAQVLIPTGIPVRAKYESKQMVPFPKEADLDPNKFTILILNGGTGLGRNLEVIKELEKVNKPLQVVVVNAANKRSKREVAKYIERHPESNLKIINLGHTDNIYEYMKNSDLYIGKAGGISITECVRAELPILVPFDPPYHECYNVLYLEARGMLIFTNRVSNIPAIVLNLEANPEKLAKMRDNMHNFEYQNSAAKICDIVYENTKKSKS